MTREELLDEGIIVPEVLDEKLLYYYHSLGYKILVSGLNVFYSRIPYFINFSNEGEYSLVAFQPLVLENYKLIFKPKTNELYVYKDYLIKVKELAIYHD